MEIQLLTDISSLDARQKWPGHRYPHLLPKDVSLEFEMSEENLFALFVRSPTKVAKGEEHPHNVDWCLLDQHNSLGQAQKYYNRIRVDAVCSLSQLEQLHDQYHAMPFLKRTFHPQAHFSQKDGKLAWGFKKTGVALFSIKADKLDDIVSKGQGILQHKKYHAVGDGRGVKDGHPKDFLAFMEDARAAHIHRQSF